MRVTGGLFRGRRLHVPSGKEVRPTTDKVRQAIFNILVHEIHGAKVLDLFAGSGSLGIEAVSRGADSAVFIEKHRLPLKSLQRNLSDVSVTARVVEADWSLGIQKLAAEGERFDLIFADPPYGQFSGDSIAETLLGEWEGKAKGQGQDSSCGSSLLARAGILIIESSARDEPLTRMKLLKERVFDTTRISFYSA